MERVAARRTSVSVEAWSRSSSASYTCRDFIPEEPMRRVVFTAALVVLVASVIALAPSTPPSAQGPITLSVIDVSGDLSSTRDHRELSEGEPAEDQGRQCSAGAGPRAARQDQGPARRRPRRREPAARRAGRRL